MPASSSSAPPLPRPATPPGIPPPEAHRMPSKLSYGVVCSSNINRSMEAHVVLGNAGLRVESYGTGTQVRLPGRSAMEPRIYRFGIPYEDMYKSLSANPEDEAFFVRNGVLQLCRRGAAVKKAPQRWQDMPSEFVAEHDVVIAFEERIFDAVIEDLQIREPTENFAPIHVICLDTKDNPLEAQKQGQVCLELCWRLEAAQDLVTEAPEIVDDFEKERMSHTPIKLLYQLCYL
ncbi:Ssu72-like protein [Nitzschia inconspicua]|uniref:RNA polymerase II subunit A C-terminal domain phosphatase SSU72 n=1 Tax=Nitzschia inconspicua TaxID=303405 RepID=A0A9K3KHS3_9STRA|nr:Ssu72-like protein [Nitzschia inconspicua]